MQWLKVLYRFPEHHISAAWWIALLGLYLLKPLWRLLGVLPIWGVKYARHQRAIKIRVLERLHEDTNRLVLYVLREFFTVALEFCWICLVVAATAKLAKVYDPRMVLFYAALWFGTTTLGPVLRLSGLVSALMDYDASLAALKRKQGEEQAATQ